MSMLMLLMILIGFWPSYYGPLLRGAAQAPWILHLHGVVYIGWMLLLVVQTGLAASGRIRQHRAVGSVGIAWGTVVFGLGIIVSFAAPVMTFNAGTRTLDEAAGFMLIPLGDMVLFGGLFFSAVAYRSQPELHKRLMILATIAIAFAAIFRMQAIGVPMQARRDPVVRAAGAGHRLRSALAGQRASGVLDRSCGDGRGDPPPAVQRDRNLAAYRPADHRGADLTLRGPTTVAQVRVSASSCLIQE
jgi:hypothetical protein